ncbi:MAG: NUDIX hydrolase [Chlamydiia bacterium]|nr:NUDIX hydrolase [Chlamydiia bacterium]MCP5509783.1 NUDIX hydrolase [Chlamydiales bacterium]HPE84904.1 NUDIX hydrolase [Chlamydiales bacterium]
MKKSKAHLYAQKQTTTPTHITTAYQGHHIDVQVETVDLPEGPKTYDLVCHPGAVAILPITDDGRIILIEQWRRAIKQILLEIPAGTLEPGEDPELCAIRELQEEIGYKPTKLTLMATFFSAPGFCNEKIHLYLATGLIPSKLTGDDTDCIDTVYYTLDELNDLIQKGLIHDAKTLIALKLYGK